MGDPSLSAIATELATAVEITLNPQVSQQARMEAYVACEKYVLKHCIFITPLFDYNCQ